MAQIFVSYARPDRALVEVLVTQLRHEEWSVWWDPVIPPGKRWDDVVEEALRVAKCVIVVWTPNSVASEWVRTEAADAKVRGVLVPVILRKVDLPLEFRRIEACDLTEWRPGRPNGEFESLLAAVRNLVNSEDQHPRSAVAPVPPGHLGSYSFSRSLGVIIGLMVALALGGLVYFRSARGSDRSNPTSVMTNISTGGAMSNAGDQGEGLPPTMSATTATTSPSATSTARVGAQQLTQTVWRKNWLTINDPVPWMGSSDGTRATNREQMTDLLTALELEQTPELARERDDLLRSLRSAPVRPDDHTYNVAVPDNFDEQFRSLKRAIRNQALDAGVNLPSERSFP